MLLLIGAIFLLALSALPGLGIVYLAKAKDKKLIPFTLTMLVTTAAVVGVDLLISYGASDFHTAAFVLQLFLPLQLFYAGLIFLIGAIGILITKGFFTKRNLIIIICLLSLIPIFAVIKYKEAHYVDEEALKKYPDIALFKENYHGESNEYVLWNGQTNEFTSVDDSSVTTLFPDDKYEKYNKEYDKIFDGGEYEKFYSTRSYTTRDGTKMYMTAGGYGDNPYGKLFFYDVVKQELKLIIEDEWIYDFEVSEDESYLIYGGRSGLVRYDFESGTSTVLGEKLQAAAGIVRISKDERFIIYNAGDDKMNRPGKPDQCMCIFDTVEGTSQKVPVKNIDRITDVRWYE